MNILQITVILVVSTGFGDDQGYCVRRLISTELHLSVFSAATISSEKISIDISNTL